jgi:hypothetical protein
MLRRQERFEVSSERATSVWQRLVNFVKRFVGVKSFKLSFDAFD